MMGYFREAYDMSLAGYSYQENNFDYFYFGFMILASPVALPLYYLGKLGHWVMNDE